MKPARIMWCELNRVVDLSDIHDAIIREDGTGEFKYDFHDLFGRVTHIETFRFRWEYIK